MVCSKVWRTFYRRSGIPEQVTMPRTSGTDLRTLWRSKFTPYSAYGRVFPGILDRAHAARELMRELASGPVAHRGPDCPRAAASRLGGDRAPGGRAAMTPTPNHSDRPPSSVRTATCTCVLKNDFGARHRR